jgi:hypothetical protein
MNILLKGAADLLSGRCGSCRAYRQAVCAILAGLWNQTAALLFVAAALLLTGCVTPYQGVYPDDSAHAFGDFIETPYNPICDQKNEWHCELFIEEQSTGYLRNYRVDSEFGVFSAEGGEMLVYRLEELDAIAELDDFSTLDIFVGTFADRALAPVRKVTSLAIRPVSTAKRIPGGYLRTLQQPVYEFMDDVEDIQDKYKSTQKKYKKIRKISRKVSERIAEKMQEPVEEETKEEETKAEKSSELEYSDGVGADKAKPAKPSKVDRLYARAEEEAKEELLDFFDLTDREKRWMHEVGMDPESKNPVLFGQIRRVAWTERLASYGTTFVTFPLMPGAVWSADIMSLAWSEPQHDYAEFLQFDSEKAQPSVQAMQPVRKNYVSKLKKNKAYPRSIRKRMSAALQSLEDIPGAAVAYDRALVINSEGAARFYTASMEMAVWYQEKNYNVIGLVPVGPAVMLQLSDARRALLMPGSLADWTPKFAMTAGTMSSGRPEVWFREDLTAEQILQLVNDGWLARDDWRGINEQPAMALPTAKNDFVDLLTKTNLP